MIIIVTAKRASPLCCTDVFMFMVRESVQALLTYHFSACLFILGGTCNIVWHEACGDEQTIDKRHGWLTISYNLVAVSKQALLIPIPIVYRDI